MKLETITLHPFGHFADRSWDLAKQLVVIHGPNELGKSTLRQAIFHTLFTPTKLPKSKLEETIGPWLPLPAGDYAAVRLTFEHQGMSWTLEKRWGAGHGSRLSDGKTSIGDPAVVQAKLGEMLAHGEATFRHVLFTGQSELEQTLARIKANARELRDVRDLLAAAAGAAADVDEQQLRRLLEEKMQESFSRWDVATARPERQNGKEKGVDDPWKRDVGVVLASWYDWQNHEAEWRRVLTIETDLDRIAAEAARIELDIRRADECVAAFGGLRDALGERDVLEEREPRLEQQVTTLNAAFSGWPKAEAAIGEWDQRKQELETEHGKLVQERAAAEAKKTGATATAAFERIAQAKQAWEDAANEAAKHADMATGQLPELERLETAITAAKNKLASRQLSWRIDVDEPGSVTMERGIGSAETVVVGAQGLVGTAEARVRVVAAGLRLTVESGGDDVERLFATLKEDQLEFERLLTACGATAVAAVKVAVERRREAVAAAATRKQVYESLLDGRTFEQWVELVAGIEKLPATRALVTIDEEIKTNRMRLAEGLATAKRHADTIAGWKQQHADHDSLTERLLEAKAALKHARDRLASLPGLPEGFETTREFLQALAAARQLQVEGQKQLTVKKEEQARLAAELAERRSEDLAEKADAAKRAFDRARGKGHDYLRIREELDRIAADSGSDPLPAFSAKVAAMFSRITRRSATVAFDGQLPAHVERDGVQMPPDRLSHGAGGALAFALRLALAEAYLHGVPGFIMLDDPFVNLDKDRMAEAADILRTFSEWSQVIFFTCHDEHAARLERAAGPPVELAG